MSLAQFTNNASGALAAGITSGATSLSVTAGQGALFPALTGSQYFRATIMHIVSGAVTALEIVKVTARATDTFTIVRAQEGTTAQAWSAGDTIALLPTAGDMAGFAQFDDLQTQATNYAADTGAANAYVVALSPAVTAHVTGMPIRWKAGHANTGASTFNDGAGAVSLTLTDGTALPSGTIAAGGIYVTFWDGTKFQLLATDLSGYVTLTYLAANYATLATLANYAPLASPTFTGNPKGPTPGVGNSSTNLATTAFVNQGSSFGANGYRKHPDGSIDQWGYAPATGTSPQAVVFPLAPGSGGFQTAVLNIVITPAIANGAESFAVEASSPAPTTSGFSVNSGSGSAFYWRAFGY